LDNAMRPSRFAFTMKAEVGGSPPFLYPAATGMAIYRVHRGTLQSGETALVVLGYDESLKDCETSINGEVVTSRTTEWPPM